MLYQLKVKGEFDQHWSEWLGDIQITTDRLEDGLVVSTLVVNAVDQSALFGILEHIRNLNIFLISVTEVEQES